MTREELQPIIIRYLSDGKSVTSKFLAGELGESQDGILPHMFAMEGDGILSHDWLRGRGFGMWSLSPNSVAVVDAMCDPTDQPEGESYPESKACSTCKGTGKMSQFAFNRHEKCTDCGGTGWSALGKS